MVSYSRMRYLPSHLDMDSILHPLERQRREFQDFTQTERNNFPCCFWSMNFIQRVNGKTQASQKLSHLKGIFLFIMLSFFRCFLRKKQYPSKSFPTKIKKTPRCRLRSSQRTLNSKWTYVPRAQYGRRLLGAERPALNSSSLCKQWDCHNLGSGIRISCRNRKAEDGLQLYWETL